MPVVKENKELAIPKAQQIIESVARATRNGFVAYNLENKITYFSPKMEEVTGWHEAEMLGKHIRDLYTVQEVQQLEDPSDVVSQPVVLFTRDGKQISLETRKTSIIDSKSNIEGYLVFFVIEDYNKDLDRAQSEFISTVSHELRTPITSIKGFASTLVTGKQKLDDEKRNKYVGIIKAQAERLERLVEDLLAVSRLESRKLQLTIHPVKILPVVENITEIIDSKYGSSHSFNIKTEGEIDDAWVDSDRLDQVLTNLIDNAVKYSPDADKVDIKISNEFLESKKMLLVEITDYGIGISEEDQRKIFTKFSRLDTPLTRKTEGTGLGLYISYSLTKLQGGELQVRSAEGKTSFCMYLPTESHEGGVVWWD